MHPNVRKIGVRAAIAAALLPVAGLLAGCGSSGDLKQTEARLDAIDGVTGSFLWTSYDGAPTNQRLSARVYVDADPGENLPALIDAGLEAVWSFTGFEPTGVGFQVVVGPRPDEPTAAGWKGRVVLEDALPDIGLDIDEVGVPSFGDVVQVPARVMVERYGDWPSGAK